MLTIRAAHRHYEYLIEKYILGCDPDGPSMKLIRLDALLDGADWLTELVGGCLTAKLLYCSLDPKIYLVKS